jgi:hypothetical protein
MAYDVAGRALYPLADLLSASDFPLADFIPSDALATVFDRLYYCDATVYERGVNTVFDVHLVFEQELVLAPPGCESFALVFASAGADWTALHLQLMIGPDFSAAIREATVGIRIADSVLRDVATGMAAVIEFQGDLIFGAGGITFENATGASLPPAYLCGTKLVVQAADVRPVFGIYDPPPFVTDESFQGLTFERLAVTIPAEYLQTDPGQNLQIVIDQCAIGTTGFTGAVSAESPDPLNPVTGSVLGFPMRFRRFGLDIRQNAILDASLKLEVRIAALEENNVPKWIACDFAFGSDGSFAGRLAAAQPTGASTTTSLVSTEFTSVARLGLDSVRVTQHDGEWAFFFAGRMKLLVSGATWPEIAFDEIGFDSNGRFLLPDGAGIGFASPLVVSWHFVKISVSKFRFGYADDTGDWLQIALSAEILLVEGIPAGASVEGLTVKWKPAGGVPPEVSFRGIGVSFGVPGTFNANIAVSYSEAGGAIEFRGKGALELTALDMGIEIGIVVGYQSANAQNPEPYAYLYLFADAKLLPTGIPIGQTGLAIFGFQGLIAYNMALAINQALPPDERFYELFVRAPIGITDINKWQRRKGQNALGVGVVLGTVDKGFSVNVKGLLVVAFPDLTILLQARANFLKLKPDLSTAQQGTLDALMVYASGQSTLSLDIVATWEIPIVVSVGGSARAFFSFTDASAWYLEIGRDEDGKRIVAQVLYWGNGWLFTGGFWFRLDSHGVVTGAQIALELRAEAGGFFVSVGGFARGEMRLAWQPTQWEGSLRMAGHIRAGYKGISIGITLGGNARARARRPFDVHVHVEASVDLWLTTIRKGFDFEWQLIDAPQLESPVRRWSATPRHWTPYEIAPNTLDTGVVALEPGTNNEPVIHPHSVLALDFAKAMVDATSAFNEAVALDDNGFRAIGEKSGWSAAFRVDQVTLVRQPGTPNEAPVTLWGTWARETLEPNTSLRLLSSERYAHDGSLTGGFVEGVTLDYCDPPGTTVVCVPLDRLEPGFGWLDDGIPYHWDTGADGQPGAPSDSGPALGPDDTLEIQFPGPVTNVTVATTPAKEPPPADPPVQPLDGWWKRVCAIPVCQLVGVALVAALICAVAMLVVLARPSRPLLMLGLLALIVVLVCLLILWRCRCGDQRTKDTTGPRPPRDPEIARPEGRPGRPTDGALGVRGPSGAPGVNAGGTKGGVLAPLTGAGGSLVTVSGASAAGAVLTRICWAPGHGTPDWADLRRRGGTITQNESWTIPADQRLLAPNEHFELRVRYTAILRAPDSGQSTPLGAPALVTARFATGGPPDRANALANHIARVQPSDGARPVYTGYDLRVQFLEDYVPYLYASVGEALMIRLFDGQGQPLLDANGDPLLLPGTELAPDEKSVTQQVWEEIYRKNVAAGCVSGPPLSTESETVLRVDAGTATLTPNSQYTAQLVSDARPNVALATWGFTTARFSTFRELATLGRRVAASAVTMQALASTTFDALAREAGVPTIRYVDALVATPLHDPTRTRCVALLLESPEPLEAGTRLSVTVDGTATTLVANADTTRVIVQRSGGGDWAPAVLAVGLIWKRDAGLALPKLTVGGVGGDEVVDFTVDARRQP